MSTDRNLPIGAYDSDRPSQRIGQRLFAKAAPRRLRSLKNDPSQGATRSKDVASKELKTRGNADLFKGSASFERAHSDRSQALGKLQPFKKLTFTEGAISDPLDPLLYRNVTEERTA